MVKACLILPSQSRKCPLGSFLLAGGKICGIYVWCSFDDPDIIPEELRATAVRELREETGISVCEDDLILIDTLAGEARKRVYPNGDIVYNNTIYKAPHLKLPLNIENSAFSIKFVFPLFMASRFFLSLFSNAALRPLYKLYAENDVE